MNDPAVFEAFLANPASFGWTLKQRNEFIDGIGDTFSCLLSTDDDEIDNFVKNQSELNRNRNAQNRVTYTTNHITLIKALMFELKDRLNCSALPDANTLNTIDMAALRILKDTYTYYKASNKRRKQATTEHPDPHHAQLGQG